MILESGAMCRQRRSLKNLHTFHVQISVPTKYIIIYVIWLSVLTVLSVEQFNDKNWVYWIKCVIINNRFFANLVEAFLYIGLPRSAGRRSACRDCHLNAAGMAECQSSDKSQNLAEEWPGMGAGVCEGCREAARVYNKRKSNSWLYPMLSSVNS